MFIFRLDAASGVPTYRQLVDQVRIAITLGYLKDGDQLPTVRDVAASLAINPNTIAKAYRELELGGLAAAKPGLGTFVIADDRADSSHEYLKLRASLMRWLAAANAAGLSDGEVTALFAATKAAFLDARNVA